MRTESDISETLAALSRVWLRSPDQRLGQLLVNAANPKAPCPEIFYMEDHTLLDRLKAMAAAPPPKAK